MTYQNYEFTAFAEADLLRSGDHSLNCGDTFTMPASASSCITVCDNDAYLSGDGSGWYDNNRATDHYGQNAKIAGVAGTEQGNGGKIYAEVYHWVQDQHGNRYVMIEIQQEGSNKSYFTFHTAYGVPAAGSQLTITQTCDVTGNWVDYQCLNAGEKTPPNGNVCGRLTFDADCNDNEWNDKTNTWDEGVAGKTVQLLDLKGNVVATTTTKADGSYDFSVPEGQYRVKFPQLEGYKFSKQNSGVADHFDSDADANGLTDIVTVCAGQATMNVDAGIKKLPTIKTCKVIEAEDMHLCGFRVAHDASASDGAKIKSGHDGYADYAAFTFTGQSGTCDLTVRAFDGAGHYSYNYWGDRHYDANNEKVWIYVNGQCVKGPVTLNADTNKWVDITVKDLNLNTGDKIKIYAAGDNCKPAMIDYVKICCEVVDPKTGKIGDTVWLDADRDGIQDAGEAGVAGVTVLLKDADGNVIATTTTDANGNYLFDNLAAGDYSVAFVPKDGTELTAANQGGNDAVDSDANQATGMTDTITLGAGEENLTVDAGLVEKPGSISGRYFCDENRNNLDDGEPGVQGVIVQLWDANGAFVRSVLTDANGNYSFTGLEPGTYSVRFQDRVSGKELVEANQGNDDTIDSDAIFQSEASTGLFSKISDIVVTAGQDNGDNDAGVREKLGSISGTYFCDENRNDVQDAGDKVIPGATVQLLDAAGNVVGTTTTDQNGNYTFTGLSAGNYTVKFAADTTGKTFVDQDQGGDDTIDSDVDGTGTTGTITLAPGEDKKHVDAGVEDPGTAAIKGRYFCDENKNDVDDGEPGIAGATVTLLDANGTPVRDAAGNVISTTTDQNGNYQFTGLAAGTYGVLFAAEATGKTFVAQDQGGDDTVDSDANPDTGIISGITVAIGETSSDNDAGVEDPGTAAIKGRYFCDENKNDVDDGEPGIAGATVQLLDAAGTVVGTTTTDANGNYTFTGLSAGDYTVKFAADTTGKTFVDQDQGGDDTIDSDVDGTGTTGTISVAIGETSENNDAGVEDPGTAIIAGRVFCDENDNDVDDGEPGITGVSVRLLDTAGNVVASTTTGVDGYYAFRGLDAGSYVVDFDENDTDLGGKVLVKQDQGNDDTIDSDASQSDGKTGVITVGIGEISRDNDAGVEDPGTAAIKGTYFCDENDNDVQDAGEAVIAGATVQLLDAAGTVVGTTTTDANGNYEFTGLKEGNYKVKFAAPTDGKVFVAKDDPNGNGNDTNDSDVDTSTGTTDTISVGIGETSENNDAGVEDPRTASVGDTVWFDANKNGTRDTGEAGAAGVTVKLLDANGTVVGTQTTDANGQYLFTNLAAGTYSVMFGTLAGYGFTTEGAAAADAVNDDSDAGLNGMTDTFVLSYGEAERDIDAGLVVLNKNPEPKDDAAGTCADVKKTVDVLANDSDPDGGTLTITKVDGKAITEGASITTGAGTIVTLTDGKLVIDGEAAYASLDIGQKGSENISYTVSDGQGGSATANLAMTFCGDANSVGSFLSKLPTSGTYEVRFALDGNPASVPDFAYDLRFLNTGDARFDGKLITEAYCLDFNAAVRTLGDNGPANVGDIFGTQSAAALAAFDQNTLSNANGLKGSENLDLINWVLAQNFEDKGYSGWEVQFAIWELADNFDSSKVDYSKIQNTDLADVQAILNGALALNGASTAGVTSFTPQVGDSVGMIVDPASANDPENVQPFIIGLNWEDYDCIC